VKTTMEPVAAGSPTDLTGSTATVPVEVPASRASVASNIPHVTMIMSVAVIRSALLNAECGRAVMCRITFVALVEPTWQHMLRRVTLRAQFGTLQLIVAGRMVVFGSAVARTTVAEGREQGMRTVRAVLFVLVCVG